ncbi:hypothetical protein BA190_27595 [Labrys sp. WJW]|uniref:DUF935 domain-containing protein n=1 Tax=Labrys sp. WJW TaxID=1737983 RepID=UPI00083092EA|nr:DUF935 domain-containing protein [Labrys sp. WJW]OCC01728.1 hypothetical protein BA190_27595 [Labrys sp. WJW]
MAPVSKILGPDGQPLRREVLTADIAGPSLAGVRSVQTGHPADGLDPYRLANILREAEAGDPMRYLELAEQIEERDLHYVGVLGTRRRSVSQLAINVDAASDSAKDLEIADMVKTWLLRDELQDELFDILDAIGKGVSFTEIIWDTSEGQWQPARLEWRDPRWFQFDRVDGRTPLLRTEQGWTPLPAAKFIQASIKAKSGLPIRSGIARIAAWCWMFKAFTVRDWTIFTQTYGQPIRIGKYDASATDDQKDVLWRAVANIAGDCAAIVPESMGIELISAPAGQSSALYKERADWMDQQISKGVLGQTATTDAIAGGHAVGQEHRQVQEDIEAADAKALSAIINRDLIRIWVDLEYGPQKAYPRARIGDEEAEDLNAMATRLSQLVPIGLKVQMSEVRDRLGFSEPEKDAELLGAPALPAPAASGAQSIATQAAQTPISATHGQDAVDSSIEETLADMGWEPLVAPMIEGLAEQLADATSLEDAQLILARHLAGMNVDAMAEKLARSIFAARLAGEGNQSLIPPAAS